MSSGARGVACQVKACQVKSSRTGGEVHEAGCGVRVAGTVIVIVVVAMAAAVVLVVVVVVGRVVGCSGCSVRVNAGSVRKWRWD